MHNNTKQFTLIEKLCSRLNIINLSKDSVNEAARISALLQKTGQFVEFNDIFIGVSAKINGFSRKTKNVKHFKRIEGLKII